MIADRDISVVVSGTVYPKMTEQCLNSIKRLMPEAEIIFSTWHGVDISNLTADRIIFNDDPGNIKVYDHDGRIITNNFNRQIIATKQGILAASRKYVLKLRSETVIKKKLPFALLEKYHHYGDEHKWHILRERIICVKPGREHAGKRYTLAMCDWWFFGRREDVLSLWDIPLLNKQTFFWGRQKGGLCSYDENLHEENYLMCYFLNKYIKFDYFNDELPVLKNIYVKALAYNFIVVNTKMFGCESLKYPYALSEEMYLSHYVYGYADWLKLYKQYCDGGAQLVCFDRTVILRIFREMHVLHKVIRMLKCLTKRIFS